MRPPFMPHWPLVCVCVCAWAQSFMLRVHFLQRRKSIDFYFAAVCSWSCWFGMGLNVGPSTVYCLQNAWLVREQGCSRLWDLPLLQSELSYSSLWMIVAMTMMALSFPVWLCSWTVSSRCDLKKHQEKVNTCIGGLIIIKSGVYDWNSPKIKAIWLTPELSNKAAPSWGDEIITPHLTVAPSTWLDTRIMRSKSDVLSNN